MFETRGLSLTRAIEFNINPFENRSQPARNLGIPESDNAVSLTLKPKLPFTVALRDVILIVVPAIELDNQARRRAEKINDIRTDWRLTAEVRSFDGNFLQCAPQLAFVRRRVRAQPVCGCPAYRC
jgi:hypothetical protein